MPSWAWKKIMPSCDVRCTKRKPLSKSCGGAACVSAKTPKRDAADYEAELNEFRQQLESDRQQLDIQLDQLRSRNKELKEAAREAELEMSRERAQLARERASSIGCAMNFVRRWNACSAMQGCTNPWLRFASSKTKCPNAIERSMPRLPFRNKPIALPRAGGISCPGRGMGDGPRPVQLGNFSCSYRPAAQVLKTPSVITAISFLLTALETKDKGEALNSPPLGKGGQGGSQNLHPKAVKFAHEIRAGAFLPWVVTSRQTPQPPLAKGGERGAFRPRFVGSRLWVAGEARTMG